MAAERTFFAQPIPGAGGRVIASPFQFVTTGEDNLRVTSVNSLAGVQVKLQGRRLDGDGQIKPARWDHTPASDRTPTTTEIELGAGALLNLAIFASAGAPKVGQTFVIVQLIRGAGAAAIVLGTLLQGYVTSTQGLGWPGSPIESSIAGGGVIRTLLGTTPAAGAEISETVPTGARWQFLGGTIALQTNATVGDRRPVMTFQSGGFQIANAISPLAIPPSSLYGFAWGQGMTLSNALSTNIGQQGSPMDLPLLAGGTIQTFTLGLAAGDQYLAPQFQIREWLEVT